MTISLREVYKWYAKRIGKEVSDFIKVDRVRALFLYVLEEVAFE